MKKLVVLSGGLDSTAVFLNLVNKEDKNDIACISFNYGQKCLRELDVAAELCKKYSVEHIIVDISNLFFIFGDNQLTSSKEAITTNYKPNIIVPLRNAIFLQIASCYAVSHDFDMIYLGSHTDDIIKKDGEFLFPDCTPEFLKSFEVAQNKGILSTQKIHFSSPALQGLNKQDLIKSAYKVDKESLFASISCYKNLNKNCGGCDSCKNRKKSFMAAGITDETVYVED